MEKKLFFATIILVVFLAVSSDVAYTYGSDFIFPAARRSAISGYTYGDPPSHLAYDYRFSMHTQTAAAKSGFVDGSTWVFEDEHEPSTCGQVPPPIQNRGNYIILEHGGELETWYFHLSNTGLTPTSSMQFIMGEYMALSGDTGCGGPHLHFATKLNGVPFDPYEGATEWVSGQPIPVGFRDQYGNAHGPFPLDNTKIRDTWLAMEGAAGSPIEDDFTSLCYPQGPNGPTSTLYIQGFERGYIQYCGSSAAEFVEYNDTLLDDVRARYSCEAGENSIIEIYNRSSSGYATVGITIFHPDGSIRDARVYAGLLAPGETWYVNAHEIVFDWLNREAGMPGIFSGYARIYSDQGLEISHSYFVLDESCVYVPLAMDD